MWGRVSGWRMKFIHSWIKRLPRPVLRMGLASDDELHWALRISQQTKQPLRVVQ